MDAPVVRSQAETLQTTAPRDPWWRALLGLIVALGGTVALFIPMVIIFAVATNFKNGNCRESGPIPDTCGHTAAQGYAESILMLVAPTVVGLLIARPRHVGKIVAAILAVALVVYLLLTFTGETIPPPPVEPPYGA
ncbi:hypothetical protein [Cellulosimicrobium funkei]|uniref:hypothetical protein n=1 Tax=Cellulosimicrobium funkei TaxID=264251 RepID=UPI0037DD2A6F